MLAVRRDFHAHARARAVRGLKSAHERSCALAEISTDPLPAEFEGHTEVARLIRDTMAEAGVTGTGPSARALDGFPGRERPRRGRNDRRGENAEATHGAFRAFRALHAAGGYATGLIPTAPVATRRRPPWYSRC